MLQMYQEGTHRRYIFHFLDGRIEEAEGDFPDVAWKALGYSIKNVDDLEWYEEIQSRCTYITHLNPKEEAQ